MTSAGRGALATLRLLARCRRGVASLEAGLIGSAILVPMALGAVQFGTLISVQAGLDMALQGGLQQIWATTAMDAAAIRTAAGRSWGNRSQTLQIADPVTTCYCLTPTATREGASVTACSTVCGSGTQLASYATLSVSATVSLVAPLPMLSATRTLVAAATIRLP